MCTYCHKVVQHYTQSSDSNVVRNLEQLQTDLRTINSEPDLSTTSNSNMTMTVPKPYPFDFDDEENIYIQPLLRKVSGTGVSAATGMSSYYEKFEQKERLSSMSGRRPFDAFGVCAAEADMLKQVSGRFWVYIGFMSILPFHWTWLGVKFCRGRQICKSPYWVVLGSKIITNRKRTPFLSQDQKRNILQEYTTIIS